MGPQGSAQFSLLRWRDAQYPDPAGRHAVDDPDRHHRRAPRAPRSPKCCNQEFVQTLRAKGLSESAVIRHVLKNSLPQVLAVMGLQFGYLLGGSILVETVFTWPGSGFLL